MANNATSVLDKPHLHEFINDLPVILIWIDTQFNVLELNTMAQHLLARESQVQGQSLFQLLPALAVHKNALTSALNTQTKLMLSQQMLEYNARNHPCHVRLYPLLDNAGALIKIEDLSHQTLLDDMVIQSEKMVTIGGLAAGMAHEIKNPLGIVLQNIQNILCRLDGAAEKNQEVAHQMGVSLPDMNRYLEERNILKFMNNIRLAIDRSLQIIATMLNFGTQNPVQMKNEDIINLIENALSFAEQDYDLLTNSHIAKVTIVRHFSKDTLLLVCSSTQITQVLFNLIKNGMQALHDIPNPQLSIDVSDDEECIIVKVMDNGTGIPPYLLENLFKPFFTTKPKEQGTGLGLAVSHYIIHENHHGSLTAGNLPEGGACFTLKMPKSQ